LIQKLNFLKKIHSHKDNLTIQQELLTLRTKYNEVSAKKAAANQMMLRQSWKTASLED